MTSQTQAGTVICIPVFDDWTAAQLLLAKLDEATEGLAPPVHVLLVDDGSTEPPPAALNAAPQNLTSVEVLQLRCNVGHQRAIALGLTYLHERGAPEFTVVMDGDGEDGATDVARLLEQCRVSEGRRIVFARRRRRAEGLGFKIGYLGYRLLHRLLTGKGVYVGNFSVIPGPMLGRVVGISELWNHYAAAVFNARLPVDTLPIDRARRLHGASKMNVVSLISHGMSAISVYGDTVGARLLTATGFAGLVTLLGVGAVVWTRLFTDLAIPGWATNAVGLLVVALLNLLMMATVFALFTLQARNRAVFLPLRDYRHHVLGSRKLHG